MPNIILEFNPDHSVTWKPAGGGGRGNSNWIEGPECPVHGPWVVKTNKEGEPFYSCQVGRDEDWCKNKAGRDYVAANPPEAVAQEEEAPWPEDDPLG